MARPTATPVASTSATGSATGRRVGSFTIRKTVARGWPAASACGQPVRASATGFMNRTRPRASVTMVATPMPASAAWIQSAWLLARLLVWADMLATLRHPRVGGRPIAVIIHSAIADLTRAVRAGNRTFQAKPDQGQSADDVVADVDLPPAQAVPGRGREGVVVVVPPLAQRQDPEQELFRLWSASGYGRLPHRWQTELTLQVTWWTRNTRTSPPHRNPSRTPTQVPASAPRRGPPGSPGRGRSRAGTGAGHPHRCEPSQVLTYRSRSGRVGLEEPSRCGRARTRGARRAAPGRAWCGECGSSAVSLCWWCRRCCATHFRTDPCTAIDPRAARTNWTDRVGLEGAVGEQPVEPDRDPQARSGRTCRGGGRGRPSRTPTPRGRRATRQTRPTAGRRRQGLLAERIT